LKEMAAKIKLSQHFFFYLVRELSDTPHIWVIPWKSNTPIKPWSLGLWWNLSSTLVP
jgi:hypothetical protein